MTRGFKKYEQSKWIFKWISKDTTIRWTLVLGSFIETLNLYAYSLSIPSFFSFILVKYPDNALLLIIVKVEMQHLVYCWLNKSVHNTSEIFFQLGLVTWLPNHKQFAIICTSLLLVYWFSYQIQTNFNNDILESVLLFFVACCYHNSLP